MAVVREEEVRAGVAGEAVAQVVGVLEAEEQGEAAYRSQAEGRLRYPCLYLRRCQCPYLCLSQSPCLFLRPFPSRSLSRHLCLGATAASRCRSTPTFVQRLWGIPKPERAGRLTLRGSAG